MCTSNGDLCRSFSFFITQRVTACPLLGGYTEHLILLTARDNRRCINHALSPVYTIQPVVKPIWQPVKCLYTGYNRMSQYNRFDNRLYRVNGVLHRQLSSFVTCTLVNVSNQTIRSVAQSLCDCTACHGASPVLMATGLVSARNVAKSPQFQPFYMKSTTLGTIRCKISDRKWKCRHFCTCITPNINR